MPPDADSGVESGTAMGSGDGCRSSRLPKSSYHGLVTENPFTVLTAVVAPAILTNACSVLALGTSNRIARVVDRSRQIVARVADATPGSEAHDRRKVALTDLQARARLLQNALRLLYAALGGFATSALIAVIGALSSYYGQVVLFRLSGAVALIAGFSAVAALVASCSMLVAESHLAVHAVQHEIDEALAELRL